MQRTNIAETINKTGQKVTISGWIDTRRDMGKIVFLDIRDRSGVIQVVVIPKTPPAEIASRLRDEWVVSVTGMIKARPEKMVNPNIATGTVEMEALEIEILNECQTPPFPINKDTREVNEETRLKYRYLDLRSARLRKNLEARHKIINFCRNFLNNQGFWEIETPQLGAGTPEGAREFLVPSRLHPGACYTMPQSPQQYKQLLMVAGMEKYFQVARCFRDEDQRGDRQPEFTQLDMEMSFVEREEVMALNEAALIALVKELFPEKNIQQVPFPRIPYAEAMAKYNSDKPDIRADKNDPNLLAFAWVVDFPMFEKADDGSWTFTHNPFSAALPEHREQLMKKENIGEIVAAQYDITLNGFEIGGGSIRNHQPEALKKVFEIMGHDEESIQQKFGHMLEAFTYGAPPHGGIAWGLDRIIAILMNEPNIREIIAFPKTGDARDPMTGAPSVLPAKALREVHIKFTE
jgi:aspartyl-tRNA synthetase